MDRRVAGVPLAAPDPNQTRMQQQAIAANAELQALHIAQNVRMEKSKIAISFLSLPFHKEDALTQGVPVDLSPGAVAARAAAFLWLGNFFHNDTTIERGEPVVAPPPDEMAKA
jgi:hypothetical protein